MNRATKDQKIFFQSADPRYSCLSTGGGTKRVPFRAVALFGRVDGGRDDPETVLGPMGIPTTWDIYVVDGQQTRLT
jgi:hypothetical protein